MIRVSRFQPAWWLRNRHLQTIVPNLFRPRPDIHVTRERIELPDGDFVDADWVGRRSSGPIVVLLHGLEGNIESRYAGWMLKRLDESGYRPVLLNFRSCSGEVNRKPNSYHSGHTADFDHFVRLVHEREPGVRMAAIGYSLGGNALLKWLGENGRQDLVETGIAASVPFRLAECSEAVNEGLSKIYQKHLMGRMKATAIAKQDLIRAAGHDPEIHSLKTFRDFDEALTAPLHGFASADDYYDRCSSIRFLESICTPTLVIHAKDDPFMRETTPPTEDEISDFVEVELSEHGGHVGFVSGRWPWKPRYFLEERMFEHLAQHFPLARGTQAVA
ncbi:MAG: hydrolase [Gammaproteobacteria bacterium]|nr:hydrolase [Gammaproteobacteria bacterium]